MSATTQVHPIPRGAIPHPLDLPAGPSGPVELLLLEDSRFDAEALTRACRGTELDIAVTVADDFRAFRRAISERRFDVVLLDYLLPEGDGLTARGMLRTAARNADVPTVMISNEVRHDVAVAAMRAGCMDYLPKEALSPAFLRDLVLRATTMPARTDVGLLQSIRQLLRQELASAHLSVDVSEIQMALSALGILAPPKAAADWLSLLEEEETQFVFRTHSH